MDETISLNSVKPGMVLKKPILDRTGRVIINAGTALSPLFISKLHKWGIDKVCVEAEKTEAPEAEKSEAPEIPAPVNTSVEDAAARQLIIDRNAKIEQEIEFRFSDHKENKIMMGLKDLSKKYLLRPL